jgi:Thymidylate synthase complementing protein
VERFFPDLLESDRGSPPGSPGPPGPSGEPRVTLVDFDPHGEEKVIAAICAPLTHASDSEVLARVRLLGAEERKSILLAYVGERSNRRHRPGRAFERTDYRFDVVTDYGAFRDLQRHRMLTIEWQSLRTSLGYCIPATVEDAGMAERYSASLERSRTLYEAMVPTFADQAPYAVALAFHLRYSMQMNAREAMHLVELRSGTQGHPAYRWVAHQMHRLIAEQAGHSLLAEAMSHVEYGEHDLERLDAERRAELRRSSLSGA